MYLFSVIIPHYNSVLSLKRLIDSIPVDPSVQLIIVDDKSSEDLSEVEILVKARSGIFLHNATDKKGAGTCRNLGLSQATGKWLVFADADDYFLENAFTTLLQYAYSESDIVYFMPTSMEDNTGKLANRHLFYEKIASDYLIDPTEQNELILKYKFVVPWSKMIKRQLVKKYQITFDEVPAANDVMFSMKTARYAKKIQVADSQIYCVTQSGGSLTTKRDRKNYWSRVEIFAKRYKYMQNSVDMNKYAYILPMGIKILLDAITHGYDFKFILSIFRYFRKRHIAIISWQTIRFHLFKKRLNGALQRG